LGNFFTWQVAWYIFPSTVTIREKAYIFTTLGSCLVYLRCWVYRIGPAGWIFVYINKFLGFGYNSS
jgi:hypothetical protein